MRFEFRSRFNLLTVAAAALAVLLAFASSPALAQKAPGGEEGSTSSTNQYTLSQATYDQINRIQTLLSNNKFDQAISVAKDLLPRARRESSYAEAFVDQLIANAYLMQKDYDAAEPYLQNVINLHALQPQSQQSVIYELATIYLSQNKYDQSINLYKQVMAQMEKSRQIPDPALYYHLGLAYSFKGDYQQAYNYIEEGIQKRENPITPKGAKQPVKPQPIPKDWYQNLFVVVYKLKDYHKANDIAKLMVTNWPSDKDFWNYYANTFLLLHEDRDATAVYALMLKRGLLKSKDDYMQLASLYIEQQAPYKAASLLSKGMNEGIVPKTADNYDLLSSTWIQAQEWDKALDALGKEAALAPTGDIYLRQASIYLNKQEYRKAVATAQDAISKGGLRDTGQAWMILGQAAYQAKETDVALKAFHKAENYKSQVKSARNWIKYVIANSKSPQG